MFTLGLVCYEPVVADSGKDMSSIVIFWLGDDIESSLSDLFGSEISPVKWDMHAVDGTI